MQPPSMLKKTLKLPPKSLLAQVYRRLLRHQAYTIASFGAGRCKTVNMNIKQSPGRRLVRSDMKE
jgi:hypothetical protein